MNQTAESMIHETAIIDAGAKIGHGTRIWHWAHVAATAEIGTNCSLGQNVYVGDASIGNNVKIQNNVSVYDGVVLEDDVFCGPSMVFTNVINPRSHLSRKHEYQQTLVRKGATIGANAVILCGKTIGRYAMIGAGAVVTRDVPDYALVVGNPARRIGWFCQCGVRLLAIQGRVTCEACESEYEIFGTLCKPSKTKTPRVIRGIQFGGPGFPIIEAGRAYFPEAGRAHVPAHDESKMEFVDLKAQYTSLKSGIDARIHAVLEHGQFIMGPEVLELEQELAKRTGSAYAVSCASGTDALLIGMMALGVGPGDEVVTTPFSFVATAETIALLGARPVFVDIDPRTYNIDPTLLDKVLSAKTKVIIPVSLYGQCAEMNLINEIAAEHGVPVIEDGAQSFGATHQGRQSCNLSTIGCTSFFPSKPLGCYGDGGACFTNDEALASRMRQIRVHGQDRRYHHPVIGINGRMDTLQAAVLLAKLSVFDSELANRARVADAYTELLRNVLSTPFIEPYNTSVYAQYTIQVEDRVSFQEQMRKHGVPTAVHYPVPLHMQPAFASSGIGPGSFPHAETAAERVVSLPMHAYLSQSDQRRIVKAVRESVPQIVNA